MTNYIWKGLVIIALVVGITGLFFPRQADSIFGAVGGKLIEQYDPYVRYNGGINTALPFQTTSTIISTGIVTFANLVINTGTTVVNNLVQGGNGYSLTISSASTASQTITAFQFCSTASVLIPQTSTTSITITYPTITGLLAVCQGVAGGWSEQFIDNESSFPVTIATSSAGFNLYVASSTGLAKVSVQYPPVIAPTSTLKVTGQFTDSTHINMYQDLYQRSY